MTANLPADRLYNLLPVVYRQQDETRGHPLRDLLRAIAEQVQLVEDDIAQLYENWFIETCDEWVIPYLGDLVGYDLPPSAAGLPHTPRADVANYVRAHRRRGTAALLELLSNDAAGFPARAVEFFTLLGRTVALNFPEADRGQLANLRDMEALDLIDSPFDRLAHTADIRNVNARRVPGRHNIPSAASWVWRLRAYRVTHAPAYFIQRGGQFVFTFSVLGNHAPLFTNPRREPETTTIAGELNVPAPIRRRALAAHIDDYYGVDKSFVIWYDDEEEPVPACDIIVADLTDYRYRPPSGKVAVDPKLGVFSVARDRDVGMSVTYHYGFSDDIGAGEYGRTLTQPRDAVVYRVGALEQFTSVGDAVDQWQQDEHRNAVIEIADSRVYSENIAVEIGDHASLQIRAANRCRPVISVLDRYASRGESLHVTLSERSRFTLDGILLAGRPLQIEGIGEKPVNARVTIRHCTLVPGWSVTHDCTPTHPAEASIDLRNIAGHVIVDHTITGSIVISDETAESEPLSMELRDSIIDATDVELEAVFGPAVGYAWAKLRILRCTVVGRVLVHAIELGENSIFTSEVRVARRQIGCLRFCYVPPKSRTPRRYHCQPELAEQAARDRAKASKKTPPLDPDEEAAQARLRVKPRFSTLRYGAPDYCQLAFDCAVEITRGADDESEMGAFHELFLPQRAATLRARLDDSTPAGMETGIIYAD